MEERVKATILGNCIGDAMGNLSHCYYRDRAHQLYASFRGEMTYDLKQVVGERSNLPAGFWREHCDMMLLFMHSLVKCKGAVSGVHYGNTLYNWYYNNGFPELYAAGKPAPKIELSMQQVLVNPAFLDNPHSTANVMWYRKGAREATNTAVTKSAVLGLYMYQDIELVILNTVKICKVTHPDPRCQASCVAVATAVSAMMQKPPQTAAHLEAIIDLAFNTAADILNQRNYQHYVPLLRASMYCTDLTSLRVDNRDAGLHTFTTLGVGFWALRQNDFREAIESIVLEAGAASSNAGLAGALLGCKLGLEAIPQKWMEDLLKKDFIDKLITGFLVYVKSPPPDVMAVTKGQHPGYDSLERVCDSQQRNILGVLYGHAIGDAIGLLTEFLTKAEAQQYYGKHKGQLQYALKELVNDRHRRGWLVGDWTDDTDQMVVMMESIIYSDGQVNVLDFGRRLKEWANHGFKELGDKMGNGLGATTKSVLSRPEFDTNPIAAAQNQWEMLGSVTAPNGAVMRTSILGVFMFRDIQAVIKHATSICKVTHADPRCQASCVAMTTAIAMMLQKKPESKEELEELIQRSYQYAKETLNKLCAKEHLAELEKYMFAESLDDLQLGVGNSIGYTYKTLGAGFWALRQNDFRTALEAIVFEAGDADTNGAVAGALLGCKLGFEELPKQWLNELKYRKWMDDIIEQFLIIHQKNERAWSKDGCYSTAVTPGEKKKHKDEDGAAGRGAMDHGGIYPALDDLDDDIDEDLAALADQMLLDKASKGNSKGNSKGKGDDKYFPDLNLQMAKKK